MLSRVCKEKNKDYYSILLSDGSIKKADKALLTYFMTSFQNIEIVDMFKLGQDGRWDTVVSDMSLYEAETYAYITDGHKLVIEEFTPFDIVLQVDQTITNLLSTREYAKMHNKSNEQIKALCQRNRIQGAAKIGERGWVIPKDAPYPADERITAGGKFIGVNRK